jgi:hypothetical protein
MVLGSLNPERRDFLRGSVYFSERFSVIDSK